MRKSTHFTGQPIYTQLLNLLNRNSIRRLAQESRQNYYTKKFDGYTHLVTYLFAVINRYDSIRELVVGLLSNANKTAHLGIQYCIKRNTFSDANHRRSCDFFGQIYQQLYQEYSGFLSESRKLKSKMRKLYIMDSTTITLFTNILKVAGRNPKNGKRGAALRFIRLRFTMKMCLA